MPKVIINRAHFKEGVDYDTPTDCPLFHAIKEQLPDFKVSSVGGIGIYSDENNVLRFNAKIWNRDVWNELKEGKIDEVELKLTESY